MGTTSLGTFGFGYVLTWGGYDLTWGGYDLTWGGYDLTWVRYGLVRFDPYPKTPIHIHI